MFIVTPNPFLGIKPVRSQGKLIVTFCFYGSLFFFYGNEKRKKPRCYLVNKLVPMTAYDCFPENKRKKRTRGNLFVQDFHIYL